MAGRLFTYTCVRCGHQCSAKTWDALNEAIKDHDGFDHAVHRVSGDADQRRAG